MTERLGNNALIRAKQNSSMKRVKISLRQRRLYSERFITENWQLLKCVPIDAIFKTLGKIATENRQLEIAFLLESYLIELSKEVAL